MRKLLSLVFLALTLSTALLGQGMGAGASFAGNEDPFGVPSKNATLIASIPSEPLTSISLPAYLKRMDEFISGGLDENSKFIGQNLLKYYQTNNYSTEAIEIEALSFWTMGQPEVGVFLLGKASVGQPENDALLSNFAAMLSMGGAPDRAIPLLEYLIKKYPDNTTLLNNLGQAWFALGELEKADANLEKTVKAFAYHPQANYTQCLIQHSKGNKDAAIEKMKNSLAYSYSLDKVNMLSKMGYSVTGSDMRVPFHPDPNPLGLQNFKRPDVPTTYADELRLSADWNAFQEQLYNKASQLSQALIPYQQAAMQQAMQQVNPGQKTNPGQMEGSLTSLQSENIYRKVAEKNLQEMNKDGGTGFRLKKAQKEVQTIRKDFEENHLAKRESLEKDNSLIAETESELAKKGESLGFDNCTVQNQYSDWLYTTYNKPLEEAYQNYLHQLYLKISEELYWKQFTQDAELFEATKLTVQKEWLLALSDTRYLETKIYEACIPTEATESNYKLADFDDLHCEFVSVLDFGVYKQVFECGKSHVEFDAGKLSGQFDFEFDDQGNDKFIKGTLEATVIDKSVSVNKGPVQIGASVKAGMGIEFTSRGIEDVYVTGEAAVQVKSNIVDTFDQHIREANTGGGKELGMGDSQLSDKGVEIGASGKMSLISGNTSSNLFVNTPK